MGMIFDAKSKEFIDIFSESFAMERTSVFNILQEMDPANSASYEKINKKE